MKRASKDPELLFNHGKVAKMLNCLLTKESLPEIPH
jgi:hypothetical protein